MIDPGTAQRSPNARRSPAKLRLHHLVARANPRSGPLGLAWRAGTEQGRLRKSASGESRLRNVPSVEVPVITRGREPMLRHVLVGVSLMGVAGAASANPLPLSDQQL